MEEHHQQQTPIEAEPQPEEADFLLTMDQPTEQGVFFGDLITLKAPFNAANFVWKLDGKDLGVNAPELAIKDFQPDDIGAYTVEDDIGAQSATIILSELIICACTSVVLFAHDYRSPQSPIQVLRRMRQTQSCSR